MELILIFWFGVRETGASNDVGLRNTNDFGDVGECGVKPLDICTAQLCKLRKQIE